MYTQRTYISYWIYFFHIPAENCFKVGKTSHFEQRYKNLKKQHPSLNLYWSYKIRLSSQEDIDHLEAGLKSYLFTVSRPVQGREYFPLEVLSNALTYYSQKLSFEYYKKSSDIGYIVHCISDRILPKNRDIIFALSKMERARILRIIPGWRFENFESVRKFKYHYERELKLLNKAMKLGHELARSDVLWTLYNDAVNHLQSDKQKFSIEKVFGSRENRLSTIVNISKQISEAPCNCMFDYLRASLVFLNPVFGCIDLDRALRLRYVVTDKIIKEGELPGLMLKRIAPKTVALAKLLNRNDVLTHILKNISFENPDELRTFNINVATHYESLSRCELRRT